VVVRALPVTCTVAPGANPVPVTVSVKALLPAATLAGLRPVIPGVGFTTLTGGLVAARVKPLFRKSRNSYCPGAVGIVTVHVRVVTPAPT